VLPDYAEAADFGTVKIHRRLDPVEEEGETPDVRWRRLVHLVSQGLAHRQAGAHGRMGDLHSAAGRAALAARAYDRARRTDTYALRLLNWACDEIRRGRRPHADPALAEVRRWLDAQPDSVRIEWQRKMAWQLFTVGQYGEAAREMERYRASFPDLPPGAFDLGLFRLASGNVEGAIAVYLEAVRRFGPAREQRQRLEELVDKGVWKEGAAQILDACFYQETKGPNG
jgi:tetratricopeptide (TPR) repeat protein